MHLHIFFYIFYTWLRHDWRNTMITIQTWIVTSHKISDSNKKEKKMKKKEKKNHLHSCYSCLLLEIYTTTTMTWENMRNCNASEIIIKLKHLLCAFSRHSLHYIINIFCKYSKTIRKLSELLIMGIAFKIHTFK